MLTYHALKKSSDPDHYEGKLTHVDSPIEKYILQVHTVAQGSTASQIMATAMARRMNSRARKACWEILRASKIVGSLDGISGAYTKVTSIRMILQTLRGHTLCERVGVFTNITSFLLTMCQPCC